MKKFYTLLCAAAVALTASALTPGQAKYATKVNALEGVRPSAAKVLNAPSSKSAVRAVKAQGSEMEGIITDPEGESLDYIVAASRFVNSFWGVEYEMGEYPGNIVWGEDGVVYVRDIISSLPGGIYVKGVCEDGKVKVNLPQVCYTEDGELYYASKMQSYDFEYEGEEYVSYKIVADEENYVEYDVDEDGNLTLLLNDGDPEDIVDFPGYIIGVCMKPAENIDDWYGYGDAYQTFSLFDEKPVVVPESVELEDWVMTTEEDNLICQVGFDGDDVYIVNCSAFIEDIAFKGTIDGDVVRFPVDQYVGQFDGFFLFLEAVQWTDDSWEDFEPLDEIVMTYDAERKVMAVDNPLVDVMYCPGKDIFEPIEYFENPTFMYQSEEDTNAAPENPYVSYFSPYEYQDWYDTYEGYIEWTIPGVNVNGYLLDTDRMYYHFLANGEVMTFTVEEYPYFDEDMTDIPYDYTDGFDLQVLDDRHYFTFKSPYITSFGLQSFYIGSDGELYASDLVTYVPENSVDTISANKEVKAVEFYNLQGQRVAMPAQGLYIMRTICADGTSTVKKVRR